MDLSGQEPGEASLLKIIGNVFIVNTIETVAEAHVLAEKTGLKISHLQEAIGVLFGGPHALYSKRMSSGEYYRNKVSLACPRITPCSLPFPCLTALGAYKRLSPLGFRDT